jgi:thymidylate synthase
MIPTVKGNSAVEAWKEGAKLLIQAQPHRLANLITEIEQPLTENPDWLLTFDPKSVGAEDRLSIVADVLFPSRARKAGETRAAYYQAHSALLQRARKLKRLKSSWDSTYFERLTSFDGSINQVENAIHALANWPRAEAAIVMHLSSPHRDSLRRRGSPCLQFVEVLWRSDGSIDLVAVYRNHDFLNKTLGNFLGLARLLRFIASETNKTPGRVICHSVHAYVDRSKKMEELLAK